MSSTYFAKATLITALKGSAKVKYNRLMNLLKYQPFSHPNHLDCIYSGNRKRLQIYLCFSMQNAFLSNKSPKEPKGRLISVLNPEVAYELLYLNTYKVLTSVHLL